MILISYCYKLVFLHSGHMDKQVLTSVKASEPMGRYVAGVFKNGILYNLFLHV